MLSVRNVNQYYGGSHILRDVSLEAKPGEVTVILGRNGVGKTTLLKSVMGVVPVKTGSIRLDGVDISRATPYERVRRGIGYVPQGREIFGRLTVMDNLRMGLASMPAGSDVPAELFELFPVLAQMKHRRGGDLSGGQQQQLAIARALAPGPRLLLLDEPVAGMTDEETERTAELFLSLEGSHSLVVVEHDMKFIHALTRDNPAKKVTVLHEGSVLAEGSLADVQNDDRVVEVYLGR
jgi:urea transport system ATP-binding protein